LQSAANAGEPAVNIKKKATAKVAPAHTLLLRPINRIMLSPSLQIIARCHYMNPMLPGFVIHLRVIFPELPTTYMERLKFVKRLSFIEDAFHGLDKSFLFSATQCRGRRQAVTTVRKTAKPICGLGKKRIQPRLLPLPDPGRQQGRNAHGNFVGIEIHTPETGHLIRKTLESRDIFVRIDKIHSANVLAEETNDLDAHGHKFVARVKPLNGC
jgi:hypothetical protein